MLNFGNKEFRNLQEQVLKNAQDIETLKGRENLQIVIVEELPETGNPNYIYLVPNEDGEESNVYNEYIWLADEEAYEQIGAVNIDLTNYVTTDTNQTISGEKTFTANIKSNAHIVFPQWTIKDLGDGDLAFTFNNSNKFYIRNGYVLAQTIRPVSHNAYDLGTSSINWKDIYLSGKAYIGSHTSIYESADTTYIYNDAGNPILVNSAIRPLVTNTKDLGSSSLQWKDFYIAGNLSDGVHSVTVANIASKVVASYASGTFDTNGESTIDISGGTPEGLFIFTYGNCQCFVRLTATMVQNADLTPIRVACPMIYNSNPASGWLNISRSSDTLTISVIDGTNHVDSGYAWTLVKTSLI